MEAEPARASIHPERECPLIRKIVRGIAAGIGLASESISAHKASKQERKEAEATSSRSSEVEVEEAQAEAETEQRLAAEQLEQEWSLDEAQDELRSQANTNQQPFHDTKTTIQPSSPPGLPLHLLNIHRRMLPGFPTRNIPQLPRDIQKACRATPWLYALNLAFIGTMWLPSAMSFVVSTLIQVWTEAAIQVDRRKTNAYFDEINEDFFRPRGLYCLVMTWEPESDATFSKFDLNTAISTAVDQGEPGALSKLKHKFKSSHGKTHNDLPFPESAPLIFPDLDAIAASGSESEIKNMKKREFLADYFDRRGQAKFTFENPTSDLNIGPKPTFTSRYADPSHPASSGDLFSLVSGGHISRGDVRPRAPERRRGIAGGRFANHPGGNTGVRDLPGGGLVRAGLPARQRGRDRNGYGMYNEDPHTDSHVPRTSEVDQQDQAQPYGEYVRGSRISQHGSRPGERRGGGLMGGAKKLLKGNVLYLMIVNMPSEEEMAAARAMFEE